MKYVTQLCLMATIATMSLCACRTNEDNTADNGDVMADGQDFTAEVDTMAVKMIPFMSDIVSNGKVRAAESADLYFRSSELISDVMVHNGQRVKKGQVLARLDTFKLGAEKSRQAAALAQARLEFQDVIIGQGYNPEALSSVPVDVIKLARIRSGLEQAETTYSSTIRDMGNAILTAPFYGIVANVKGARHTMASTGEPFCRVINDNSMRVEFPILESELSHIQPGEIIEVTPYSSTGKYRGNVSEINPVVDETGHIAVKALINSSSGLIDGINVRIRISHDLGRRLVVPKSAVVLRTGRQVVFTYEDGKAMWNYVTTGLENLDSYEIVEGLKDGNIVIYNGNENLAHETPVVIASDK